MTAAWPIDTLDVPELLRAGFRPVPFRQFVIKVHSHCNLACDYCYVYRMADSTWRSRPGSISAATADQVCRRIAEHVTTHELPRVSVVFHGGEPLLAGAATITGIASRLRRLLPEDTAVDFAVQTNGVLLTEAALRLLHEAGIRVGVSFDGDPRTTARHRRFRDGRSSHDETVAALRLLSGPTYREAFAGLLCVMDLRADPVRTYESLVSFAPPQIDFLLPHANWSNPPEDGGDGAYGRWLTTAFDRWYGAPRWETEVRLFGEIANLLLGGESASEQIGLSPVTVVVIDTDGSLEQVDSLRSAYHGAAATGLNVHRDPFDAALRHPAVVARQIGPAGLSATCRRCPIGRICGGGYYPHRYRAGSGFRHPSVYCGDLEILIRHIATRLRRDVTSLRRKADSLDIPIGRIQAA